MEQRSWAQRLHAVVSPLSPSRRETSAPTHCPKPSGAPSTMSFGRDVPGKVAQQIRPERGLARAVELLESETAGT
ncbi:hypothetical protein LY12_001523 [Prauserella alba]|nr:hypothetical protein [Prauserella alba]